MPRWGNFQAGRKSDGLVSPEVLSYRPAPLEPVEAGSWGEAGEGRVDQRNPGGGAGSCLSCLRQPGAVRTGRLSLVTLAGTVWILRAWDIAAPAGLEPVVTLSYDAGRFTGTGGCNRYFAVVEGGAMAGEVKVGPLAATRMACPEPQSSVEARFLEQLGGARTVGFMLGRLAISYTRGDGSRGTMLFNASTPPKEP